MAVKMLRKELVHAGCPNLGSNPSIAKSWVFAHLAKKLKKSRGKLLEFFPENSSKFYKKILKIPKLKDFFKTQVKNEPKTSKVSYVSQPFDAVKMVKKPLCCICIMNFWSTFC